MSKIIISLSNSDIGNLLNGCELSMSPSVSRFDNLQTIVVKHDDYNDYCTVEEEKSMGDMCGDDRFEVIAKAKKALLESTNIEQSLKEMEVLDNFLFRCWQMGWLDKYDEKKEK